MPFSTLNILAVAASAVLALGLTPLVRTIARRYGMVAKPKTDRWHKKPTAMFGGVAIWLAVVVSYLIFIRPLTSVGWRHFPGSFLDVVMGASTFLFLVGLADDFLHTKPYQKLIGQVMGSAFVIYYGLTLPWTGYSALNVALTIFWLIGITNAVNLLDNMDGLASGIAIIASGFLALSFITTGHLTEALLLLTFAGALLVFWFTTPVLPPSSWAIAVQCSSDFSRECGPGECVGWSIEKPAAGARSADPGSVHPNF